MKDHTSVDGTVSNVRVPLSVINAPSAFGGQSVQDALQGDLVIKDGRVVGMLPSSQPDIPARIVLPKFTEAHVHLDKCHTISRMEGVGGDLQAAIDAQAKDRLGWTTEDIRARASLGLDELVSSGCGTVRTHVDWGQPANHSAPSKAWPILCELKEEYRDKLTIQIAPLTGIEDLADLTTADRIARQIADKGGVLGSFVFDQTERESGIRNAFKMAEKHGLALDFHVDEGLEDGLDGLAIIAETAISMDFQGPVLCGHACSLMNQSSIELDRLAEKLARARISVVSLPSANLYLQGRTEGTPDRRGLTRIRELQEAGVNMVIGTDNVRDAFCPLGRFDPRQTLALATLAAHLDPPFGRYLPMITTNARAALGLTPQTVDEAAIGDLIQFDANSTADLLGGVMAPRPLSAVFQGDSE